LPVHRGIPSRNLPTKKGLLPLRDQAKGRKKEGKRHLKWVEKKGRSEGYISSSSSSVTVCGWGKKVCHQHLVGKRCLVTHLVNNDLLKKEVSGGGTLAWERLGEGGSIWVTEWVSTDVIVREKKHCKQGLRGGRTSHLPDWPARPVPRKTHSPKAKARKASPGNPDRQERLPQCRKGCREKVLRAESVPLPQRGPQRKEAAIRDGRHVTYFEILIRGKRNMHPTPRTLLLEKNTHGEGRRTGRKPPRSVRKEECCLLPEEGAFPREGWS